MYLYLKAAHIVSVVAWMASLFYIFRLFVYHRQNRGHPDIGAIFMLMELRLLMYIAAPAGLLSLFFGAGLLWLSPGTLACRWIWWKLCFVAGLLLYQWLAVHTHRCFKREHWIFTEKQCRLINEAPTLLLLAIVFLAVLKPC